MPVPPDFYWIFPRCQPWCRRGASKRLMISTHVFSRCSTYIIYENTCVCLFIYLFVYLLFSILYIYSILFYTVICSSLYFLFRYSHAPPLERLEQRLGRNGRWRVKCWRPSKASDPPWNTSRAAAKPLRWGSASPKIWAAWSKKLYIIVIYIYIGCWFGTWISFFHSVGNNHPNWLS